MVEIFLNLKEEHQILIVLYLISYVSAMLIQIKDPKCTVTFLDWVLGLLCSALGGTIMFFGVMQWANIGFRMAATILVSLMSYRTIIFIVSPDTQEQFARGFGKGIMNMLEKLFTNPPAKKGKDE